MIRLAFRAVSTIEDARNMVQTAIGFELGTLPPYLYALFSIPPDQNIEAAARIRSVAMQEMIHMCLACNILNAIGGDPVLKPLTYPTALPGDIGPPGGEPLTVHLWKFSHEAMKQGMAIEEPEDPPDFPVLKMLSAAPPEAVTIGQFYAALDLLLSRLPESVWQSDRRQIDDSQFFAGQLFKVDRYRDASNAIRQIVSEGEGTKEGTKSDPLDFQHELAHYYRFAECDRNQVLTKDKNPLGYAWGPPLGVDWSAVYPAIPDPGAHDFSKEPPAARAAQDACNEAYSRMIDALQLAVTGDSIGKPGQLGIAVRAMFDLRMAASVALRTPLANPKLVAGPGFRYTATGGTR